MKFRKKPVVIDAIQFQGANDIPRVSNWLAQQAANIAGWTFHDTDITIPTLEGDMRAMPGDWIIKGVKGEFYPCKPDIFSETYEEVNIWRDRPTISELDAILSREENPPIEIMSNGEVRAQV